MVGGEGVTEVGRAADATTLGWSTRDCFFVPSWQWHQHKNASPSEPAFLFSVTGRPVMESLVVYRVEKA